MTALDALHQDLEPDVRDVRWRSNCAGEVFLDVQEGDGLRIGHFQGDAKLAAFVVAAHNALVPVEAEPIAGANP